LGTIQSKLSDAKICLAAKFPSYPVEKIIALDGNGKFAFPHKRRHAHMFIRASGGLDLAALSGLFDLKVLTSFLLTGKLIPRMKFSRTLTRFVVGATLYLLAVTLSQAQSLFYGGNYDGRIGVPSQWAPNLQALTFDDFGLSQASTLQSIWGNFGLVQTVDYFIPTQAYCEIRSGVSAGDGGTLLFSDMLPVQAMPTGVSQWGLPEYQVSANVNLTLPAGIYWLGIAPFGSSIWDEADISSTSGGDIGPANDPNPLPTGFPIADGMSYFYDPVGYNFVPMAETTAGPGTWDFSYGVGGVIVPEPSILSLLAVSIMFFSVALRYHRRWVKPARK
jgi:hypothetical protein